MKKSISRIIAFILAIVFSVTFISSETENLITVDSSSASYTVSIEADYETNTLTAVVTDENGDVITDEISYAWYQSEDAEEFSVVDGADKDTLTFEDSYSYYVVAMVDDEPYQSDPKQISTAIADVKIQNDIYRDDVLTALLVNSDGDVLYYSDGGSDMTTFNSDATYTWYRYNTAAATNVYTDMPSKNAGTGEAPEDTEENTLTPTMGATSYYYYVTVSVGENKYTSETRIANIYTGITIEIEQEEDPDGSVTLQMVVYDDNGDVMRNDDGSYYYNDAYTTVWYKSKEYFASTGDGTTADENSAVTTSATIPLGYAPQDYYQESNYMRVSNDISKNTSIGYTNTITVESEEGRYYYVDINKNKTNGTAEAGADPVFVRNCTSTVVVEDHIAEDGTFKAVVYDVNGNQVTNTDSYTYTWYKTVSGTSTYTNDKDVNKTSDEGRFISSYDENKFYFDSGYFVRSTTTSLTNTKRLQSEYGGTLPEDGYGLVRENFSEELKAVSGVFAGANYTFNANTGGTDKFTLNQDETDTNDGSSCNVATDEGQLRYYYVEVKIDGNTTYKSAVKYVKYSNQIENGGFQDYSNTSTFSNSLDASTMAYWQTTNQGYSDSGNGSEAYYRYRPQLEIGNYLGSTAYGTYGNYYSYPSLTYDKEDTTKIQKNNDNYLEMGYDDDSTTDYVYSANQFCEINSTDSNTLYQTVMTIPDMPLYWSLTHHARTSSGSSILNANTSNKEFSAYNGSKTTADLGATVEQVQVAIDVMYVVIMNETDAEQLLANGDTLEEQQAIIDAMVLAITENTAQVKQTSEDGSTYLARYDGSYTYSGKNYSNISVWRVQTGSTKVTLTFGTDSTAKDNAEAAAKNEELLAYYAKTYGTVKSYSYGTTNTTTNVTTYYAAFYTESETYSDTYVIPAGQYVSRYFFVAGNSANTKDAKGKNAYTNTGELSFGTYTNDNEEKQTITDYNGVKRATNGTSAGNFIDNVRFMQQLDVEVNYWLYQQVKVTTTDENGNEVTTTEWKYVLQSADTETLNTYQDRTVTADADTVAEYYSKYKFVGSYVSVDGGDENTPTSVDEDGNSVLGTATSFKADADDALVMDLYYKPYTIEFTKKISGLPDTMSYADFEDKLTVYIYSLTTDTGEYKKSETPTFSDKLKYSSTTNEDGTTTLSLTLSTDAILEKGTYLISESTEILLTDDFDGWFSVGMAVSLGALEYDEDLGGFILVVNEDENGIDSDSAESKDAIIEIEISNSYKPVSVDCEKSVIFGSTDVDEINEGLTGENTTSEKLNYKSLTEYDEENSVDDTDLDDEDRLAVLSGDTLTYRMVLTSTGNSNNVKVVDSIPEGCTLVNGSIKILYQKRSEKQGSHYGIVQEMLNSSEKSDSGTWTLYDTDETTELYKITYDSDEGEITWNISEIGFYEVYYVEYEVTVDQIKASSASELLTNDADWSYHSGFISDSTNASNSTSTDVKMNMTTETTNSTISYTVKYSNLSSYTVTWLKDTLPDGFTIEESTIKINDKALSDLSDYIVTYYDSKGNLLKGTYESEDIATILITSESDEIKSSNGELTLTFKGTQSDVDDVRNTAGIKFTQSSDNTVYSAVVSYGEGTTNQVQTDVTHLYLNIEKQIESEDPYQTFIFKVEYYEEGTDDPDGISYVNINCTEYDDTNDYYYGSRFIQTDRRGTYVITEVTDWSYTDYDDSVTASGENAKAPYDDYYEVTTDTNKVTVVLLTDSEDKNSAFLTKLGSLEDGTYTTSVFKNTDSDFAYRSGQAYTVNIMQ